MNYTQQVLECNVRCDNCSDTFHVKPAKENAGQIALRRMMMDAIRKPCPSCGQKRLKIDN